jgi:cell division protein FtsN
MIIRFPLALLVGGSLAALAVPALADVKTGVDAWARGDYATAVREWSDPAAKGDPDAQFNMAQAYRLGRGVEPDQKQAEVLYAKAAAQGHIKAADNYGLLLFQDGRREEAMPYVTAAAERGDPRAQYLLGIAHFNGDLVPKDWVRAYALLTLANGASLPQAAQALQQMDTYIPLAQREQAQVLAQQIKQDTDVRRAQQLAAVDLALAGDGAPTTTQVATAPPEPALPPRGVTRIPQPIATVSVSPSVAAAQAAIAEAERVTGTESPATAGADFARPAAPPPAAIAQPARTVRAEPAAAPPPRAANPAMATAPVQAANGPWKVQLGAFGVKSNADKLWARLASNPALAGKEKLMIPSGSVTRLLAGGYDSEGAAQTACSTLKRAGQDCLVTR